MWRLALLPLLPPVSYEDHAHRNDSRSRADQAGAGDPQRARRVASGVAVSAREDSHGRGNRRPGRSLLHAAVERRGPGDGGAFHQHLFRAAAGGRDGGRRRAAEREVLLGRGRQLLHQGGRRDGLVGHRWQSAGQASVGTCREQGARSREQEFRLLLLAPAPCPRNGPSPASSRRRRRRSPHGRSPGLFDDEGEGRDRSGRRRGARARRARGGGRSE